MTEESALAPVAEPEIVIETEGQTPENAETTEAEGEQPEEQKSASKERREREKAAKVRLREELQSANQAKADAEARANRILQTVQGRAEPKEGDYPDYADYQAAKASYVMRKDVDTERADESKAEAQQAQKRAEYLMAEERAMLDQHWSEQAREAQSRYADFDKVVAQPGLFPTGTHLGPLVQMSEMAADLAYRIASDRALHDDLLNMSPVEAARAIGRIEANMTAPKPRTSTQAPDPVNPVRGTTSTTKSTKSMSYLEFKAFRDAGGKI